MSEKVVGLLFLTTKYHIQYCLTSTEVNVQWNKMAGSINNTIACKVNLESQSSVIIILICLIPRCIYDTYVSQKQRNETAITQLSQLHNQRLKKNI